MTRVARVVPVAALLLVVAAGVAAQDTFEFAGNRTSVVLAEGRERTVLEGAARVVSDEITLEAERIELFGTDFRFATTTGGVRVVDTGRGMTITADSLNFDRETEDSRATGQVMVEDEENDLLVKGGYLETRDGGELLLVQIAVRVLRDDLTARAQFLRYRRSEDVLELSGFPVVYWKGDEYRAARIVLNLDTEEIELQGQVRGSVVIEDDDEESADDSAPDEDAAAEPLQEGDGSQDTDGEQDQ